MKDITKLYLISLVLLLASVKTEGATNNIQAGQTITGAIAPGQSDYFSFSATNGESVTILMGRGFGEAFFSPQLELYSPNGLLVSTSDSPSVTISALLLTNTGNYLIVCHDANDLFSASYGLSLIKNPDSNLPDPDGGVLLPGERKTGNIGLGDLDVFSFSATNGDSVTVLMGSAFGEAGFVPQLELYAPSRRLLTIASGAPARLSECLDESGTYLIVCRDVAGVYGGSYDISLNLIPLAPIPPNDPYPHLAFSFCGDQLRLRWLTNAVGFQLESTATLEIPNSWSVVTNAPELNLDQYVLGIAHTEPRKFFRLRHP